MATNYEKLKNQPRKKAGRKPLSPEEKQRRVQEQKRETRRRAEARRRAYIVLQHKYEDEFKQLFAEEYANLESDSRFSK